MVQKSSKRWFLAFCTVVLLAFLVGGAYYYWFDRPDLKPNTESPNPDLEGPKPDISSEPAETKVKVTLYFGDKQAMYLVPEEREVVKGNQTLEEVVVNELIKGPLNPELVKTIPDGTILRSVQVVDGIAYVNFSKDFQTKHWGGSAGETFTLYSVINSLAKLEGIQKVQFLLEGEKMGTLAGHIETTEPMAPQWNLVQS
ncbi:MAG: GerMN domain-containing protein [Bacillota bacterium]